MKIRALYLVLIAMSSCMYSYAQSFTASVNTNSVTTTTRFQLTFTINASGKSFTPPNLSNFHVLSGPSQSSQTQIVNGKVSRALSYSYILQAKKEGKFQIGSASMVSKGKTLLTKPITIVVSKAAKNTSKNLFIRAIVNKTKVYQGEALNVTFRLYTKVNVINYTSAKTPALNGFWSQEIKLAEQNQAKTEVLNGVAYRVYDLSKMVLFPQRSGTLEIDPFEGEFLARVATQGGRSNDPFDVFFRNRTQDIKMTATSSRVKINVSPLPPNAPTSFNGAVGILSLSATCQPREIETNDAINLNIKIKGNGNLKLIESPKVKIPTNIESYDPKVLDNISTSSAGVNGTKTFEHVLIPRFPGNYSIEPISFTYFDLKKRNYVTLTSGPFNFKVSGEAGEMSQKNSVNKSEVELLNEDIRFIKTNNVLLSKRNTQFIATPTFYTLMAMPILFFGLVLGFKKKIDERIGDVAGTRSRKANKVAIKKLVAAKKSLVENNEDAVYENILNAIWGYLSDKFNIPVSELTKEHVDEVLKESKIEEHTISHLTQTINTCEMGRYSPSHSSTGIKDIYEKAVELISTLESKLK